VLPDALALRTAVAAPELLPPEPRVLAAAPALAAAAQVLECGRAALFRPS
jgi:hypothetical protein